jgi:hypothetical protein
MMTDAFNKPIKATDEVVFPHETIANCLLKARILDCLPETDEVVLMDPKHPQAGTIIKPASAVVKIAEK